MYLNIDDSRAIDQPTLKVVQNAIDNLQPQQFIILGGDQAEHYVQAMFEEDDYWVLEYRKGVPDQHFGADAEQTTIDDVRRVFEAFYKGEDLAPLLSWEPVDLTPDDLDDGEVEYNGVIMNAEWPEQIEAAQLVTQLDFDGVSVDRITFGKETNNDTRVLQNCGDCGVLHDQFHVPGCEVEQCPQCAGVLTECECDYDY